MPDADKILRDRLLNAASELFSSQGYRQTSLRQIADKTGVSHGSIRYHFGSKDDLYRAVIHQLEPSNIGTHFPVVPPASEMTKPQAIGLFREFVLTLATIKARVGAHAAIALQYIEGQGGPGSAPNREFYKIIAPGHESFKRIIQAIRPDIQDESTLEILTFNIIFQCVMLRSGRGVILKRLKKRTLSKADINRIANLIIEVSLAGIDSLSPKAK